MLEGYVHPDFTEVARVLRRQIPGSRRRPAPGGAAVCVWHRGEVVVDCWGGTRNRAGDPWLPDTLALSYSTTKGVAATLLHVLADRGLIDYEGRVCEYWPEFAAEYKDKITVRHVLCHEAGLYRLADMIGHAREMLDWQAVTAALARSPACHEPGAAHGYHAFTFGWLVGELVQRVTGKPFGQVLEEEIAKPLELDGLFIGLPADQMHRRAELIEPKRRTGQEGFARRLRALGRGLRLAGVRWDVDDAIAALMPRGIDELDFNGEDMAAATLPSANGIFTARSLAKMYAILAAGGSLEGVQLVSPETVERARRIQNRKVGRVVPFPMQWRLGYHRVNTMRLNLSAGFGHAGFGGSGGFADPERNLAVALVLNSGAGTPFGDLRIVQISTAALRCADRR